MTFKCRYMLDMCSWSSIFTITIFKIFSFIFRLGNMNQFCWLTKIIFHILTNNFHLTTVFNYSSHKICSLNFYYFNSRLTISFTDFFIFLCYPNLSSAPATAQPQPSVGAAAAVHCCLKWLLIGSLLIFIAS